MSEIDTKQIESKALAIPEQAKAIIVCDNVTMEKANGFKLDIKAMIKEIDDTFKPMAQKAHEAHKMITTKWAEIKKPLEEADLYIAGQVKVYLRKIEEIRQAEEARQSAIARQAEEEHRLAEAEAAEKAGDHEEAQAIIEEPITFTPPVVKIETPKVNMTQYRTNWKWRVTDFSKIPDKYKTTDDVKIGAAVRSLKKEHGIPGIEAYGD